MTGARQDDTTLITVVLHSRGTTYSDTSRMLDFGFGNFRSVSLENNDTTYSSLNSNLTIAGLPTSSAPSLTVDPDSRIILPNNAEFEETTSSVSFDLPENAPDNAIAAVCYSLGEHQVGTAWLTLGAERSESPAIPEELLSAVPTTIAQVSYEDEAAAENSSEKTETWKKPLTVKARQIPPPNRTRIPYPPASSPRTLRMRTPPAALYRMAFLSHRFSFLPLQQL